MTERYVRPALTGRELPPRWLATVRFRVVGTLALLLAAYLLFLVFDTVVTGADEQDPGVALCRSGPAAVPAQPSGTDNRADVPPPLRCDRLSVPAS